jgi:hypothetical protein
MWVQVAEKIKTMYKKGSRDNKNFQQEQARTCYQMYEKNTMQQQFTYFRFYFLIYYFVIDLLHNTLEVNSLIPQI